MVLGLDKMTDIISTFSKNVHMGIVMHSRKKEKRKNGTALAQV